MSKRAARGTKRKCQSEECEATFYDLNREDFGCPICGTAFDHEAHASALAKQREDVPDHIRRRLARELPIVAATDAAEKGTTDNEADVDGSDVDEVDVDEASDTEVAGAGETAIAQSPDVLLDNDEDEQDSLADSVPKAVSDGEDQ